MTETKNAQTLIEDLKAARRKILTQATSAQKTENKPAAIPPAQRRQAQPQAAEHTHAMA